MAEGVGSGTTEIRTFLIADVRGYTRYTQERGDEAAARLAARFAEVVAEVVAGRDGRVVELRGDEALCVFGSPRGALRAAVDLQRRCADELRADPSVPLRVGVGIDAGEAVAVAGGYRGGALNLAARLCSIAGPGEVLVSEGVVHLARHVDEMSYVDRGRVKLKGMDEPVHVMELSFDLDMPEAASVAGRRWTRERLAALAAGIIMVVALVVVAAMRIGGGHAPVSLATNVVGFANASGRILGQVPLGGRPGGVAVGASSVWATDTEHDSVVEIDLDRQEGGHRPRRRGPDRRGSGWGWCVGRRQRRRNGVVDQLVASPVSRRRSRWDRGQVRSRMERGRHGWSMRPTARCSGSTPISSRRFRSRSVVRQWRWRSAVVGCG